MEVLTKVILPQGQLLTHSVLVPRYISSEDNEDDDEDEDEEEQDINSDEADDEDEDDNAVDSGHAEENGVKGRFALGRNYVLPV